MIDRFIFWLAGISPSEIGGGSPDWSIVFDRGMPLYAVVPIIFIMIGLAIYLYRDQGPKLSAAKRGFLMILRSLALLLFLLVFMQPRLEIKYKGHAQGYLAVLLDRTQSMTIKDNYENDFEAKAVIEGSGLGTSVSTDAREKLKELSRHQLVAMALDKDEAKLIKALSKKFKIRVYTFANEAMELTDSQESGNEKDEGEEKKEKKEKFAWWKNWWDLKVREDQEPNEPGLSTNIHDALLDVREQSEGYPLSGVLIFTDGGHNRGTRSPLAQARLFAADKVPIFTIGIGEPKLKDLKVSNFYCEEVLFKDDKAVFYGRISHTGFEGVEVNINLKMDGKVIGSQKLVMDQAEVSVEMVYTPKKVGTFAFTLEVVPEAGERIVENNIRERQVQIIEDKIKVLIIEDSPRWEMRYLRGSLSRDRRIELKIYLRGADAIVKRTHPLYLEEIPDDPQNLEENKDHKNNPLNLFYYDFIILGDISRKRFSDKQLEALYRYVVEDGGGLLLLAGPQYNPGTFSTSPIKDLYPIRFGGRPQNSTYARSWRPQLTKDANNSNLFRLSDDEKLNAKIWSKILQPQKWYYKATNLKPGAISFIEHERIKFKSGRNALSLMSMQFVGRGKVMFMGMDSTWRWRKKYGDLYFTRFWGQLVQYMGLDHLQGFKALVQVFTDKRQYDLGDVVKIEARALDKQYQPIKDNALIIKMIQPDGTIKEITLSKDPNRDGFFSGTQRVLQQGKVAFRPNVDNKIEQTAGTAFVNVILPRKEFENASRNDELLTSIAKTTNGQYLKLNQLDELLELLKSNQRSLDQEKSKTLWDSWPLWSLIIFVLCLEWWVRKSNDLA